MVARDQFRRRSHSSRLWAWQTWVRLWWKVISKHPFVLIADASDVPVIGVQRFRNSWDQAPNWRASSKARNESGYAQTLPLACRIGPRTGSSLLCSDSPASVLARSLLGGRTGHSNLIGQVLSRGRQLPATRLTEVSIEALGGKP